MAQTREEQWVNFCTLEGVPYKGSFNIRAYLTHEFLAWTNGIPQWLNQVCLEEDYDIKYQTFSSLQYKLNLIITI